VLEIKVVSKLSRRNIPRINKMSSPISSGFAVGGGPGTAPSSRSSSPAKPAQRTDYVISAPGDFTRCSESKMLTNMYDAITELNLWGWLHSFTPKKNEGFMWAHDEEVGQIGRHPKVDSDGHSGASFAWCMRHMEVIAKKGWNHYYYEFIVPKIDTKRA
jgi:hypothetical protein